MVPHIGSGITMVFIILCSYIYITSMHASLRQKLFISHQKNSSAASKTEAGSMGTKLSLISRVYKNS